MSDSLTTTPGSNSISELDTYLDSIDVLKFNLKTLSYTSCYCEENIYMLCKTIKEKKPNLLPHFSVIFISNLNRSVPLWQQKAGRGDEHTVIWDYHVILLYKNNEDSAIYDFDTLLPFPSPTDIYFLETFKPNMLLKEEYQHCFRFIPADTYLSFFKSDRSHMLKKDGTYIAQPPNYPPITKGGSNIDGYINMGNKEDLYGRVYTNEEAYDLIFS